MTILIYDRIELQERASKHLKAWKACHLVLYTLAAVCGLMNFVFIQNTMHLVDDNCVLFPRKLEFKWVELPIPDETAYSELPAQDKNVTETAQVDTVPDSVNKTAKTKRDTVITDGTADVTTEQNGDDDDGNNTIVNSNTTHRKFLDTSRTLFENDEQCQFAEFMPIMSTIFAMVWLTMFTMCPAGGHSRAGLQQPWRILMPALLFSIVVVGLTGRSFTITNKGLHAFCGNFSDLTNSTTCSSVDQFLERGWNASWGFGGRTAATRAASGGVLATWACAAALLVARCLAAPDFHVKKTGVYLNKDPLQKVTPHLRVRNKSPRSQRTRSNASSPTKRDTVSVKSEPTAVTELVSAPLETGPDSAPSSLMSTPVRLPKNEDNIEMSNSPHEQFLRWP